MCTLYAVARTTLTPLQPNLSLFYWENPIPAIEQEQEEDQVQGKKEWQLLARNEQISVGFFPVHSTTPTSLNPTQLYFSLDSLQEAP